MKQFIGILLLFSVFYLQSQNPYSPNKYQYVFVDGGSNHTVALRCDGTVLCWGDNSSGQLGDNNSPTDAIVPVVVTDPTGTGMMTDIIAIDAGAVHTLALRTDGTVWAWGGNSSGQLGINSLVQQNYPVQVLGVGGVGYLTNVVAIAAGSYHSLAILDDGTVVGWGDNQGQLGDNTNTTRTTPVVMSGLDHPAIAVAGGGAHTLVLQNNGTIKSCGDDFYGQLGNDQSSDKKDYLVYVRDDNGNIITNATGIDAGESHSLAVLNTGQVLSWGSNSDEQIGRSTTTPKRKVALPLNQGITINNAVAVRAGAKHSIALLSDSSLAVWGDNDYGQLGLGTFTNYEYPTALSLSPYKVLSVSAGITGQSSTGGAHTVCLLDNDSAMTWGLNDEGQLGNNTTGVNANTPQKVTNYFLGTIYADAGPDQFYCNGDSVQLGGESPGNYSDYTYQWYPSLGLSGGAVNTTRPDTLADPWSHMTTNSSLTINYILIKNYRYDTMGACVVPDTCKIDIRAQATAGFVSSAPGCTGENVNFINTGSSGSGVSWAWDFGANATPPQSVVENPSGIIYNTSGLKLITLIVTDSVCGGYDIFTDGIMIYDNPIASFSSTAPACIGDPVHFTNTGSSGSQWIHSWDFGAGAQPNTSTGENPTVFYTTPGIKTITLTVTNGHCAETYTGAITINETPEANFTSTAPECTGLPLNFTNTGTTGSGWNFLWDFGAGATPTTSTMENPTGIVYATAGTKLVQLTISNANCSNTIMLPVNIHLTPTVSFSSNAPVCRDEGINLLNTGSTGSNWAYFWNLGSGANPSNSSSENPSGITYSSGGSKTITFTIYDGNCIATHTDTIDVYSLPYADAGTDTTICSNRSVMIGTPALANHSYKWFPSGSLDNDTIAQPVASPIAPVTTYIVNVTNTITMCDNYDSITVTMLAPLIANAGTDVEICLHDSVQIGTGLLEGQEYSWTPLNGINNSNISNPWVSPDTTTTYELTVTGTNSGCDPVTDQVLVTVHPLPDAMAGPDDTITTATSVQLFATGGVQYAWTPWFGLSNPAIHNPVASPDTTTEYVVWVTDVFGCMNSDTLVIVVYNVEKPFWLPTAFTPNGDGQNDILYVRGDLFETFEFKIFNRYGELIFYSNDIERGWDGRRQDSRDEAPADAYMWSVNGKLKKGNLVNGNGLVNLIR
ncbi:MAG: PKD domain-containing protein [Bacteroidales bacterium]|nr:PKD domain-containing protein [Bacteroidales bacterium]